MEAKLICLFFQCVFEYAFEKRYGTGGDIARLESDIALLKRYLEIVRTGCEDVCEVDKYLSRLEKLYTCPPVTPCNTTVTITCDLTVDDDPTTCEALNIEQL